MSRTQDLGQRQDDDPATLQPQATTEETPEISTRRTASVYDAVAGRIGMNGFLDASQLASTSLLPLAPEEVLLKRTDASERISRQVYETDQYIPAGEELPKSDLLKAVHAYASDFYDAATHDQGLHDFASLDETALLAVGILLEEAAREVLGDTGDMALVEPEGMEHGRPETKVTKHQIKGKVRPPPTPEYRSEDSEETVSDDEHKDHKFKRRRLR